MGQTKLLIMLYKTDDSLVRQTNISIVETAITKIVKNLKSINPKTCEYNPEYIHFLLNISVSKDKTNKKNISFIQKILEKEVTFKTLLFLDNHTLALSPSFFSEQPLRVPYLYHK